MQVTITDNALMAKLDDIIDGLSTTFAELLVGTPPSDKEAVKKETQTFLRKIGEYKNVTVVDCTYHEDPIEDGSYFTWVLDN